MFFVFTKVLGFSLVVNVVLLEFLLFLLEFIFESGLLVDLGLVLRSGKGNLLLVDVLLEDQCFFGLLLEG